MRPFLPLIALTSILTALPARAQEPAQTYELRGFFGNPENLEVSVRKPGAEKSQWLRVGEKADGMVVEKADSQAGTATLRVGNATYNLRLAGQSASTAVAKPTEPVVEPKKEETKPVKMDAKSREELAKKGKEFFDQMTEEQSRAMDEAIREKFESLEKAHPEWKDGPPKDPEALEAALKEVIPILREGLEAAAKVPGKDGKPLVVPANLDDMLRAGLQTEAENAAKRKAAEEAAK